MTLKETSDRVLYAIAYDKTRQLVLVYPVWRGARSNTQVIGEYAPDNPRANLEDYSAELAEAVTNALARVGQDIEPYEVRVTPLDGTKEVVAKELGGPIMRVPKKEQVPVSANTTVAMATAEEEENGTPQEVPTLVTKEVARTSAVEIGEPKAKKATKRVVKKVTEE